MRLPPGGIKDLPAGTPGNGAGASAAPLSPVSPDGKPPAPPPKSVEAEMEDIIKEIEIPDMIYRDDIGEKLEEELPTLQQHGFATEFTYE